MQIRGLLKENLEEVNNLVRERGNAKCASLVVTTGLNTVPLTHG